MNKLRHSLMRSRTPTGAEMKQQNSLDVPMRQTKSASFDEVQMKTGRRNRVIRQMSTTTQNVSMGSQANSLEVPGATPFLCVPTIEPKRSRSFDSGCSVDDESEFGSRRNTRPSSLDKVSNCIHCVHLETLERRLAQRLENSDQSNTSREEDLIWENSSEDLNDNNCGIKVTLSPHPMTPPMSHPMTPPVPEKVISSPVGTPRLNTPTASRRLSRIGSPKLERQPAITSLPVERCLSDMSSQENSIDYSDGGCSTQGSFSQLGSSSDNPIGSSSDNPIGSSSDNPEYQESERLYSRQQHSNTRIKNDITETYLNVPDKLDRAHSLDIASFPSHSSSTKNEYCWSEDEDDPSIVMTRSKSLEPLEQLNLITSTRR